MLKLNCLVVLLSLTACQGTPDVELKPMPEAVSFGTTQEGQQTSLYTLTNSNGMVARLTNFGATLVELHVPDAGGQAVDVVLGFEDVSGYQEEGNQYFGCIAGRVANRIAGGEFELEGQTYKLATNNDSNHLHGGDVGLGQRVWTASAAPVGTEGQAVRFSYTSPDGEEGYPGTLQIEVTYTLTEANELRLDYECTTDATTIVNPTHHSYFNLAGHGSPSVLDHQLQIMSAHFTPTDETLIPTGDLRHVQNSPLDFREPTRIGERIAVLDDTAAIGYDHNYAVGRWDGSLRLACALEDPGSKRRMEIWTTEPGLQVYTGNFLFGQEGKGGASYPHRSALCLETQHFPDSIHHEHFPSTVLETGGTYTQTTVHRFTW